MFAVATPLFAAGGQYSGHLANCVDLTERKQAEGAVRRHLALLRHAGDAMLLLDRAGAIRDANLAAESMYGYTRAELLARAAWRICARREPSPACLLSWNAHGGRATSSRPSTCARMAPSSKPR